MKDPRRGERVFLRTLPPADAGALELENTPELNEFNWYGAREPGLFRRRVEEGVHRGYQWRAGAWHDMVVYSRLRSDA